MKKNLQTSIATLVLFPLATLVLFSLVVGLLVVVDSGVASASTAAPRPFRMQEYGYVVDEGPHAGDCSFATVIVSADGVATHMGAVDISRTHCFSPFNDPPIYEGEWEAEGANGDKVYGAYEGTMTFTEFDADGNPIRGRIDSQFPITGGTGKFQGASGGGRVTSDYDLVADAGTFISEGIITY
jgi:hypothetical protein